MHRRHELPFGAELAADGVRFRLWAPRARSVAVAIEEASAQQTPMLSEGGGWFSVTVPQTRAGTRYRWVLDGQAFPDPAARFSPDGVHEPSEVIDPAAYEWRDRAWHGRPWHQAVVYELHVGTFSDSGDYAGVVRHLDHLIDLGVTAIELMPLAAFSGQRNWGYDGVQLFAPAAAYGRPDDLKALVDACHVRGLSVLLDVVYNHFGPDGNYLTTIAPDFFTERHHTPWGAAINYDDADSRPVRDFMIHNALYWLEEYHFDGLRLDAVHAIVDDSSPDILTELAETVRANLPGREIHLVLENDNNEARRLTRRQEHPVTYTAQWNDDLHHALHVLVSGETRGYYIDVAEQPAAHLARALATGFAYQGEASQHREGRSRGEPSSGLPAPAFIPFLQNHDQVGNTPFGTRITSVAEEAAVHAAVAVYLLSPQIPMLFMGEEWASESPFLFFCDFGPPLDDAVRDGRRREFAQYPEFNDLAARERIPDPTAYETFAASKLDWNARGAGAHARWLERYTELLAVRRREIMPRLGGIMPGGEWQGLGSHALRVSWRFADGARLLLLANFAAEPVACRAHEQRGALLYSTMAAAPADNLPPSSVAFFLRPGAGQ